MLRLERLEDGSTGLTSVAMVPERQLWTLQEPGRGRIARGLAWAAQRHTGFRWEAIRHIRTPTGATAYSLRLSQRARAIAYREGDFLRFVSLHPDHDSAYRG